MSSTAYCSITGSGSGLNGLLAKCRRGAAGGVITASIPHRGTLRRASAVAEGVPAPGGPRQAPRSGARDRVDVDAVVDGGQHDLERAVAGQVGDRRSRRDADPVAVVGLVAQSG